MGNNRSREKTTVSDQNDEQSAHDIYHIRLAEAMEGVEQEIAFATEAIDTLLPELLGMLQREDRWALFPPYYHCSTHVKDMRKSYIEIATTLRALLPSLRKTSILYKRLLTSLLWPGHGPSMRFDEESIFETLRHRREYLTRNLEKYLHMWVEMEREVRRAKYSFQDINNDVWVRIDHCQVKFDFYNNRDISMDKKDREVVDEIVHQSLLPQEEANLHRRGMPPEIVGHIFTMVDKKKSTYYP